MIRRPPRSTPLYSSAASDVYKRQGRGTSADCGGELGERHTGIISEGRWISVRVFVDVGQLGVGTCEQVAGVVRSVLGNPCLISVDVHAVNELPDITPR